MTLTKTLKFEPEVLSVLRSLEWDFIPSCASHSARITAQLDRKMYERVNAALEAMGGKWNRSAKAHLFKTDPRPQVDGLLETGALVVERDGFFETPREVVLRMLDKVAIEDYMDILEPSAGLGAIARVVLQKLPTTRLHLVEKNKARYEALYKEFDHKNAYVYCADFMSFYPDERYDLVLMNPPFEEGQDCHHIRHAYNFLKFGGKLVSIMGEGAFFRSDNVASSFRNWLAEVRGCSEKLPEGSFKESGTGVNTRLVVIAK
jgi:hypothetical protein